MDKENYDEINSFENNQKNKKKKSNVPLIIFTIILAVMVIVVALVIVFGMKKKAIETAPTTVAVEEIATETTTSTTDNTGFEVVDQTRKITDTSDSPDFSGDTAANLSTSLGKKYQKQVVWTNYSCQTNDTLQSISDKNEISLQTLLSVNKIKNLDALKIGTVLRVPDRDGSIYVVKKNDMLGSIVEKLNLNITWKDLEEINGLENDNIKEGQELFIPDEGSSSDISTASSGLTFLSPMKNGVEKIIFNTRFTDPITNETAPLDGICLTANSGTEVHPSCDGEVLDIEQNTGSRPNSIKIRHNGGYVTSYGYLATINVGIGESVTTETVIGIIDNNNSYFDNPMLFFKIEQNGVCLDPAAFF